MDLILIGRIVVGIILVILIIPQGSGGGLGSAFGGTSYHTRRGMEKGIFNMTIVAAVIFVALSIATLM